MVMSWVWLGMILISLVTAAMLGNASALTAGALEGAQDGVVLAISMAGAICLWSGVGRVMEAAGVTGLLSRLLRPVLRRLFPGTQQDREMEGCLCGNICANLLGLGNAATPMGIRAAQRMALTGKPGVASDQLCRLVVLNTASIQLLPTTVAAVRLAAGCQRPFDILPAVWLTSICAAAVGLGCAWVCGHD